jgi:serine phosphatase RsbU (regulator of sigma subunit)
MLLLYTDGIIEARSESHEFFAVDRLDQVLRALPRTTSAYATIKELYEAVAEFSPPGTMRDDQTVVAARFHNDDRDFSGAAA